MERLILVKYGEIALKGGNRERFERMLVDRIRSQISGLPASVERRKGRIFVHFDGDQEPVIKALKRTFGIVSFAPALKCAKDAGQIDKAALRTAQALLREDSGSRFKIEARRTDKSFALTSYQIACRLGDVLRTTFCELEVDVRRPNWVLHVEIRDAAYVYGPGVSGPGGLPLGASGKGMLLLSGGIDSPVAGYLMAKRGLAVDAVHFDSPPFTSQQARAKVESLGMILAAYIPDLVLHVVPFAAIQMRISERSDSILVTLLMRACMVRIAQTLADRKSAVALVTGECLGQVASQTPESIRFTGSLAQLPIFRPLIGMDKEEIICLARAIGTFETSIQPYEDCCTLFAPAHPLVKPNFTRMQRAYEALEVEDLLEDALAAAATSHCRGTIGQQPSSSCATEA